MRGRRMAAWVTDQPVHAISEATVRAGRSMSSRASAKDEPTVNGAASQRRNSDQRATLSARRPVDPGDDDEGPVDPGDDDEGPVDPGDDDEGPVDPGDDDEGPADPGSDDDGPAIRARSHVG